MKQEQTQNLLLALLAVCVIAVGSLVYTQSATLEQQAMSLQGINQRLTALQLKAQTTLPTAATPATATPAVAPAVQPPQKIALLNSCKTAPSAYIGLCYDYPSSWILTGYKTEMDQRPAVRITSEPGRLFTAESTGGPGTPGVTYFQKGYQINIEAITTGSASDYLGKKVPGTMYLFEPVQLCNEVGCPAERYYANDLSRNSPFFEIDVNYDGVPTAEARANIDTILKSIDIGP